MRPSRLVGRLRSPRPRCAYAIACRWTAPSPPPRQTRTRVARCSTYRCYRGVVVGVVDLEPNQTHGAAQRVCGSEEWVASRWLSASQASASRHSKAAGVEPSASTATSTASALSASEIIHEADLDDERYNAPEAPGLDITLRGLSMVCTDQQTLTHTTPIFDGLYEYYRRATLLGHEPA